MVFSVFCLKHCSEDYVLLFMEKYVGALTLFFKSTSENVGTLDGKYLILCELPPFWHFNISTLSQCLSQRVHTFIRKKKNDNKTHKVVQCTRGQDEIAFAAGYLIFD